MIETVKQLLITLHNCKSDPLSFHKIISENLQPYCPKYDMDGVEIFGLFIPKRGKPAVICSDNGSLIAVNPEDIY